jgi:hypothetical protein
MRFLTRVLAIIIILFIIPSTACAFWLFNLNRVAFNQSTYATIAQTPRVSTELARALLDGFTHDGTPRDAHIVLQRLPPDAWETLSEEILPSAKAKALINRVFNSFFEWLDGKGDKLDVSFNFDEIKRQLTASQLTTRLATALRTFPPCNDAMLQELTDFTDATSFDKFPVCKPNTDALTQKELGGMMTAFGLIAQKLPESWFLADELTDMPPAAPTNPATGAATINVTRRLDQFELDQMRAYVRLQSRLLVLLFLIPIALLCVLIMVRIRSLKGFFRWIGWALVISGIVSLLPVFLLPGFNSGLADARVNVALRVGTGGGQALGLFAVQLVQAIFNDLTLSVLFQVAGLIVVGLLLVFISVILPARHDELSDDEMARLVLSPAAPTGNSPKA